MLLFIRIFVRDPAYQNRKDEFMNARPLSKAFSAMLAGVLFAGALPLDTFAETTAAENRIALGSMQTVFRSIVSEADSTELKNGDVNADGKIDEADAAAVLTAALADAPQADVNADGMLDQTDADMIASFVSGEIGYFPVGTYYQADPGYVTRGEWIHALSVGFAMKVEDESTIVEYFTDLEGCNYKKDIDLAANFGVFDILEEEFHPDEYVTRDFAAHTMNFCIGYAEPVTVLFADTDAVYYDADAQISLNRGWFKVENSEFRPSMYVTSAEAALAYADMQAAYEAMQIDDEYESTITYDTSVLDLTECETLEYSGDQLVLSATSKSVQPDSDISFMLNGQVIVRHVTAVSVDEATGNLTMTVEDAEDALVSDVDAEGYAYIDFDHMESLQEGIEVEVVEPEAPIQGRPGVSVNKSGKISLDNVTVKISGSKEIGGGKLTIAGSLSKIKIPYTLVTKGLSLKEFYLGFEGEGKLTATYSKTLSDPQAASIPLATVPIAGIGVMGVNLVISAYFTVTGEISIGYTFDCSAGLRYKKGDGWSVPRDLQCKYFSVEAAVKFKGGVKIGAEARIGKKKIGELYAAAGVSASVKTSVTSESSMICTNIKAYLYAEFGAEFKLFSLKFSGSWEFINEDNTPVLKNMHIENGKEVPSCTRGQKYTNSDNATKKGGSLSGKKSGGYVKGSGYSSGYTGGTKGQSVQQVYYKSTIVFKELEPPTVISEDMVLTEDTTYHTDLEITKGATLDLNGHTLTVDGNVTLTGNGGILSWKNGRILVNGGKAIIKGNVHESGSQSVITMTNKDDYVRVEGDFIIDSNYDSANTMTAGTLELQGNISGASLNSRDMHTVILSGTNDITVNVGDNGQMFNMLEIKNSDKRKITVDKYFLVSSSTQCDGESVNFVCNESGNNASVLQLSKLTVDKLNIKGDHTLRTLNYQGSIIEIDGNAAIENNAKLTLNKATVHVTGNMTGSYSLNMNGSTVNVDGNFQINAYDRTFDMSNKNDRLNVGGNLSISNTYDRISDGIITVKGDVTFGGSVRMNSYNQVILAGEDDVTIYMPADIAND